MPLIKPANSLPAAALGGFAGVCLAFTKRLQMVGLAVLLGACAQHGVAPQSETSALFVEDSGDDGEGSPIAAAGSGVDALPDVTLTGKILYQLMMSEIAAQRGLPDAAFVTELNLATETRDPRLARRATELAVGIGQPAAALQAAKLWVELAPNSAESTNALLTILVSSNRLDEAEPIMRRVLLAAGPTPKAFGQIHGLLSRSPNRAGALALFEKLTADSPGIPEVQLMLAQSAQTAGEKAKAIEHVRTASSLKKDWDIATIMLAQYLQPDSPRQAEETLIAFLNHHPKSIEVRLAYANFLVNEQRKADASAQFQRLLSEAPTNPDTLYALGTIAYRAGSATESEAFFKRFLEVSQKQYQRSHESSDGSNESALNTGRSPNGAYVFLAQIAEDRKDYDQALDWLSQVQGGSDFLNAHIKRATILAHQGKLQQAREELTELAVSSPRDRALLTIAEAQLLRDSGQEQAAFDLLSRALANQPDNPELLYEHGMSAVKLNQLDAMETSMRKLIRLRPAYPHGYNALGYTLADNNVRLPEALALIEKAMSLAPDDPSIIDSLGWVHYRLGNLPLAIENLQRAYRLRADADVAAHLGEALWASGQHAEAEKIWAEASRKEPANEALRQTLLRLNVNLGALNPH